MKRFDLSSYASDGIRVLSGREKGEAVRKDLHLDELDGLIDEEVFLVVPPTLIRHVNSSFFLGLIGESVKRLGRIAFAQRYKVEGLPGVEERFRQAVDRMLLTTAPLP